MFFPMEFSLGTATAAHQVEGNNTNNNWYQWEYLLIMTNLEYIITKKSCFSVDHWNRYPNGHKTYGKIWELANIDFRLSGVGLSYQKALLIKTHLITID